jgi:hypothetical protein
VTWLKRENAPLPERNISIFPEFQSIWQEEKENIQSAGVGMFIPLTQVLQFLLGKGFSERKVRHG